MNEGLQGLLLILAGLTVGRVFTSTSRIVRELDRIGIALEKLVARGD